jgi:type I restriction enzyme S subunit
MSILGAQLPTNWTWQQVSDLYRVTKKPRDVQFHAFDVIPFVPMELVPVNGKEHLSVEMRAPAQIASGTYFEKGDILLSKITPSFENGKQGMANDFLAPFGVASTEVIPLQPTTPEVNSRLLFYYLLHPEVRALIAGKMEGSTGRQRVPERVVLEFPLPNPPREEQDKIAAVLWKVQRAIDVEEKLTATARELKQAAMRQLFTYGLRGEGQQETEIGHIPDGWSLRPLAELREFLQYGTSAKCEYAKQGNPVLRIPNILDGDIDAHDLKWCKLSAKEVDSWVLEQGDVLFIRTNGVRDRVGTCAVYHGQPECSLFASYLIRARLKKNELNPDFFQYFSNTPVGRAQLAGRASPAADGKFNVNTKHIDAVLVPLPKESEEQHEIVNILQALDRKIAIHERKRTSMQELFKILLHKLMTGEISVADLEIDVSEVTQ